MTTEEKIINNKVGLLRLAETLGNVSLAYCRVGGFPRYTLALFPLFLLVASAQLSHCAYRFIITLCLTLQTLLFWVFLNWEMVS